MYNPEKRHLLYLKNRQKKREASLAYYYENKERRLAYKKRWLQQNKKRWATYIRNRYHTDPIFRISLRLRQRITQALKHNRLTIPALTALGCTVPELKAHLESKFQPGMTWENWGKHGWHIDHIVPLSSFDLNDPEQLKQACHFSNLQPLWAHENWSKHATVNLIK